MSDQEIPSSFRLYRPGDPVPSGMRKYQDTQTGNVYLGPTTTPSIEQESTAARVGQWLKETGTKSALPAVGSIAGGLLGGLGGPIGAGLGAGIGAVGGMGVNALLGIEKELRPIDYAIGGGLAMAPGAVRVGARMVPGTEVGAQEIAREAIEKIPGRVLPGNPSRALYASLPKQATIALPNTTQAAAEISQELATMAPSLRTGAMQKILTAANQLTDLASKGGIDPATFQANVTQFGRIVRQAKRTGAIHEASASKVYGALLDDLEAASTKTGSRYAPMLREAAGSYKRELASERLAEILGPGTKGVRRSRAGFDQTNFDAAVNKIRADKDLARWIPGELEGITRELQDWAKMTPPIAGATGPGVSAQSFAQRGMIGVPIASLLMKQGLPWPAAAMTSVAATEGIAHMLTTAPGRLIVRTLLRKGVPYDQIGQFASQLGAAQFR